MQPNSYKCKPRVLNINHYRDLQHSYRNIYIVIFQGNNHLIMRNVNVRGNVVKSRKFGFFVQEFRLHNYAIDKDEQAHFIGHWLQNEA